MHWQHKDPVMRLALRGIWKRYWPAGCLAGVPGDTGVWLVVLVNVGVWTLSGKLVSEEESGKASDIRLSGSKKQNNFENHWRNQRVSGKKLPSRTD